VQGIASLTDLGERRKKMGAERVTDMRGMSNLEVRPVEDAAWDSFVVESPQGHLLQSSRWGALRARFGWGVERVALTDGQAIVAGAQVLYRILPFGATLAYVPKGPLVDWADERVVRTLLAALRQAVQRHRAFCLKLEPNLLDDPTLAARLVRLGLRPSPQTVQPRSTILIDLHCEEDEIMARFKKKTRRNVRAAARRGVIVWDGSASDLSSLQSLLEETARRKNFAIHSGEFYRAAYDLFVPSGHARLLLATYQDTVLAGIMVFALGREAWSLCSASGSTHRNLKPNYLLQWEAIRWAKERGCPTYDMWGIPDEDEEVLERGFLKRSGGLWGVYGFKRGFGGRLVRYLGAYDDVYLRPLYRLYNQAGAFLQWKWGETWHRRLRAG